jgi:secondary thiamine-phosphate synthase enzyme
VPASKIKCGVCGRLLTSQSEVGETPLDGQHVPRRTDRHETLVVKPGDRWAAEFAVDTSNRREVDITDKVGQFARGVGVGGLVNVFVPHATAGLALMETDSGSEADLGEALDRLFPGDDRYAHRHGSRGHGRSHIIPVFVSPSVSIPCDHGSLLLGRWQRLVLVDHNEDNFERRVLLSFIPGRE